MKAASTTFALKKWATPREKVTRSVEGTAGLCSRRRSKPAGREVKLMSDAHANNLDSTGDKNLAADGLRHGNLSSNWSHAVGAVRSRPRDNLALMVEMRC